MAEVQILSKIFVKPPVQTPQEHQTYNLSFFDMLAPHIYASSIYFYPFNPSSSSTCIQEVLKKSLSETLSLDPPMAGRLNEDGLSVCCQDQGVLFVEAQANRNLADSLSKVHKDLSHLDVFYPQDISKNRRIMPVEVPFFIVQATTFVCGGLALAIYRSHAIADGTSGTTFINHWATIARLPGNYANLILQDFHLPELFPTNLFRLMPPKPKASPLIDADNIVRKVFFFDGGAISVIKAEVISSSDWGVKKYYHPSRVVVVTASIWKALILISRAKHGYLRPSVLMLTFNLRGRTSSPVKIPKNSFGNCYVPITIRFPANKTDDVKLHDLVGLVGETIQTIILDFSKASTQEEITSLAVKLKAESLAARNNKEEELYGLTSWCKFPFYGIDFGWGTPSWFGTQSPSKVIVLTDTKCGNGIEAKVGLTLTDMLQFEGDPDITALNSTLLSETIATTSLLK